VPVKKIFQVEVDDTQFKAFKTLFDRYQAALDKLPDGWKKVALGVGAVTDAHVKGAAAAEKQGQAIDKQVASVARAEQSSAAISNNWRSIATNARELDKAMERSVVKLAKWGGLATGLLGGLGAVGIGASLFGIDKLAGSIGAARTAAMGLGITRGQNAAYNLNYGKLVGAGGIMSNISTAKYDFTSDQYTALLAAGISPQDVKDKDPAQLFSQFMHNLPGVFAGVPKDQIGSVASGRGLTNIASLQDIVAYLNASPDERAKIERDTQKDSKDLDLQDRVQRQWQDFVTQLSRATETMKTKLMDKLSIIEPGLEDLSKQVTAIVAKFIDSGAAKAAIDWLGVGLEKMASYVGKPEFQDDVKKFVDWVGSAADAVWKFVSYFTVVSSAQAETLPSAGQSSGDPLTGGVGAPSILRARGTGDTGASGAGPYDYSNSPSAGALTRLITEESQRAGIDPRIMEGIRAGESGHRSNYDKKDDAIESSWGPFQLNRRRGLGVEFEKETGLDVRDPRTIPAQARWVAQHIKKTHSTSPWMGFHGLRDPDPHWGDSGYDPAKALPPDATPAQQQAPTPHHDLHQAPAKVSIHQSTGANVFASMFSIAQGYAPISA
jgi:hypothetical protein